MNPDKIRRIRNIHNRLVWIIDGIDSSIKNGKTHQWLYLKFQHEVEFLADALETTPNAVYEALGNVGVILPDKPKRREVKKVRLP